MNFARFTLLLILPIALATASGCSGCDDAPDAPSRRDGGARDDLGGTGDLGAIDSGAPRDFGPPPDLGPPPGDVHVVITADNAYSFAYGSGSAIDTFIRGSRAVSAEQIFNCPIGNGPESYTVPTASAPPGAYLYIVTWDDLSVTQGVLGEFERDGSFVYTGDARFEVCATGLDYSQARDGIDPIAGPTEDVVEAEIARCNAAAGDAATTSKGWVDLAGPVTAGAIGTLAVGEANELAPGGEFPGVCQADATMDGVGIDAAAQWMWYTPGGLSGSAFRSTGTNTFKAFLIFRLPADEIILF